MAGIRAKRHAAESQARWAKWGAANSVATGHAAKAGRPDSDAQTPMSKSDTASAAARAARRSDFLSILVLSFDWGSLSPGCSKIIKLTSSAVNMLCTCRWRDLQRMKRNNAERLMLSCDD